MDLYEIFCGKIFAEFKLGELKEQTTHVDKDNFFEYCAENGRVMYKALGGYKIGYPNYDSDCDWETESEYEQSDCLILEPDWFNDELIPAIDRVLKLVPEKKCEVPDELIDNHYYPLEVMKILDERTRYFFKKEGLRGPPPWYDISKIINYLIKHHPPPKLNHETWYDASDVAALCFKLGLRHHILSSDILC